MQNNMQNEIHQFIKHQFMKHNIMSLPPYKKFYYLMQPVSHNVIRMVQLTLMKQIGPTKGMVASGQNFNFIP